MGRLDARPFIDTMPDAKPSFVGVDWGATALQQAGPAQPCYEPPQPGPGDDRPFTPRVDTAIGDRNLATHNQTRIQSLADELEQRAKLYTTNEDAVRELNRYASSIRQSAQLAADDAGVQLRAALQETFDEDRVSQYIAIRSQNLKRVIRDGQFKSSVETGKGTYKTIAQERFDLIEKPVFNLTDDALRNVDDLPKYGFISNKNRIDTRGILDNNYGETYIRLKPNVRRRSTVTLQDSFDGNRSPRINPAVPLNDIDESFVANYGTNVISNPNNARAFIKEWGRTKDPRYLMNSTGSSTYTETQIYGRITLDDIDEILVQSIKDRDELTALLRRQNVNIKVSSSGHHERLYKLNAGNLDELHSLSPVDIDNLGEVYIDRIFRQNTALGWAGDPNAIPQQIRELGAKARASGTLADKREFLREYYRRIALKEEGGLPKVQWKDFRPSQAGYTEDVLDKSLLESYPDVRVKSARELTGE